MARGRYSDSGSSGDRIVRQPIESRVLHLMSANPTAYSNFFYINLALVVNEIVQAASVSIDPSSIKEILESVKRTRKTISALVKDKSLLPNEAFTLIKPLAKVEQVMKKAFQEVGGKLKDKKFVLPEKNTKDKVTSYIKKKPVKIASSILGVAFGSPALMLFGDWIQEKIDAKREAIEEEQKRLDDAVNEIHKKVLEDTSRELDKQAEEDRNNQQFKDQTEKFKKQQEEREKKRAEEQSKKREKAKKEVEEVVEDSVENIIKTAEDDLDDFESSLFGGFEESRKAAMDDWGDAIDEVDISSLKNQISAKESSVQEEDDFFQKDNNNNSNEGVLNNSDAIIDTLKEQHRNWNDINSEKQVSDRDFWLKGIYDILLEAKNSGGLGFGGSGFGGGKGKAEEDGGLLSNVLDTAKDVGVSAYTASRFSGAKKMAGKGSKLLGKGGKFLKGLGKRAPLITAVLGASQAIGQEEEYLGPGAGGFEDSAKTLVAGAGRAVINSPAELIEFGAGLLGVDLNLNALKMSKKTAGNMIKVASGETPLTSMKRKYESIILSGRSVKDLATANDEEAQFYRKMTAKIDPTRSKALERIASHYKKGKSEEKTDIVSDYLGKGLVSLINSFSSSSPDKPDSEGQSEEPVKNKQVIDPDSEAIEVQPGVSINGIDPSLMESLNKASNEYFAMTGKPVTITSGFRSREKQAQLYQEYIDGNRKGPVAKPGTSKHERGLAIDIDSTDANDMASKGLLSKYGLSRPVQGEAWHLEKPSVSGPKIKDTASDSVGDPIPDYDSVEKRLMANKSGKPQSASKNVNNLQSTINNNMITHRDMSTFIDDPYLRFNANNGVA